MTTQEVIDYYSNLLLSQYNGLPLATGMVQAFVTPIIMNQLPNLILNGFEIGTAVGPQLDVLGKYVGVTRSGLGLNQQPITLDDSDFTTLIMIGIVNNNLPAYTQTVLSDYLEGPSSNYVNSLYPQAGGYSLFAIDLFLQTFFPGTIFCYDNLNMELNYLVTSAAVATENLFQMIVTQNLLPQPMGVAIASTIYLKKAGLFSMVSYSQFTISMGTPVFSIPTWSSGTTYSTAQNVYYQGIVYRSATNANVGNTPSVTSSFWIAVTFPMTNYDSYANYTQTPAYTQQWQWLSYTDVAI
jgi:Protein of unknown function (DUF2612)